MLELPQVSGTWPEAGRALAAPELDEMLKVSTYAIEDRLIPSAEASDLQTRAMSSTLPCISTTMKRFCVDDAPLDWRSS